MSYNNYVATGSLQYGVSTDVPLALRPMSQQGYSGGTLIQCVVNAASKKRDRNDVVKHQQASGADSSSSDQSVSPVDLGSPAVPPGEPPVFTNDGSSVPSTIPALTTADGEQVGEPQFSPVSDPLPEGPTEPSAETSTENDVHLQSIIKVTSVCAVLIHYSANKFVLVILGTRSSG